MTHLVMNLEVAGWIKLIQEIHKPEYQIPLDQNNFCEAIHFKDKVYKQDPRIR